MSDGRKKISEKPNGESEIRVKEIPGLTPDCSQGLGAGLGEVQEDVLSALPMARRTGRVRHWERRAQGWGTPRSLGVRSSWRRRTQTAVVCSRLGGPPAHSGPRPRRCSGSIPTLRSRSRARWRVMYRN